MILFMWGMIFVFAVIPGALVGWLIGKIPVPTLLSVVLVIGVCAGAGLAGSICTSNNPDASLKYHFESLAMFLPPILLSAIIGLWISRAKRRADRRPWYLPPEA
jgi:NhaP-type Na+/H+ or K+/H+ antiporter